MQKLSAKDEALAIRAEIRRVARRAGLLRLRRIEVPRHGLIIFGLCALGVALIVPQLLLLLFPIGLIYASARWMGDGIAWTYRASKRGRLRGRLVILTQEERDWVLAPLEREYQKDLREFAEELGRDLGPVRTAEVTPASIPSARGDEAAPIQ